VKDMRNTFLDTKKTSPKWNMMISGGQNSKTIGQDAETDKKKPLKELNMSELG